MSLLTSLADRLDRARRRVLLHRRPLAALACAGAAWAAIQAVAPPPPRTVGVWTAAHPMTSGTVLAAADLTRRRFSPGSVPDDRIGSPAQVIGRVLARPVGSGAVLAPSDVVGDHWLDGRSGTTAVPVRVTDAAVVPLLRVGDRVALLAADPQGRHAAELLATDATVLAVPRPVGDTTGALPGRLVVVGVPTGLADTLAAEATRRYLTVMWNR